MTNFKSEQEYKEAVKRMLNVINEDPEIGLYDIEKTFKKSYERLFKRATGFNADHSAIHGINTRHFTLDYNTDISKNVEKFYKLLEDKKISLEEFTLYYHNCILTGKIYGSREKGFNSSGNIVDYLVSFLRHIEHGKPDKSLKETYEYMEATGIKYNDEKFKIKIGDCTVVRFKNGTLKISDGRVIDIILRLKEINDLLS